RRGQRGGVLERRDGHRGDAGRECTGQEPRGRPVAGTDVAHHRSLAHPTASHHVADEVFGGITERAGAGIPEAVVDVFAPERAIVRVQVVVVAGDVLRTDSIRAGRG